MKKLMEIEDFGGTDADQDPLLFMAFEDHSAYRDALALRRTIVIGRKGSGKTAIFRKLMERGEHDVLTAGHVFSAYPWHHHAQQRALGVPEEECYTASWTYLINLTFSKILLNEDGSQPWSDGALESLSLLERFVRDTYGVNDPQLAEIFSPAKTIKLDGKFGFNWGVFSGEVGAQSVGLEYLPKVIYEVNSNLTEAILNTANPELKYLVCFDELDAGFQLSNDDYRLRLIGLLIAAKRFNAEAQGAGKNLAVVILLRDDIFNALVFEEKNKIVENSLSLIAWDTDEAKEKLSSLMEKRFSAVLGDDEEVTWDDVFNETEQMTGRQTKYNHMLDRTFLRPRDMIKFCNEVLDRYKRKGGLSEKFQNGDISDARTGYSRYLYRELRDEVPKHYPDYDIYLQVLREIGYTQFTRESFASAYGQFVARLRDDCGVDEVLRRMFEFSIVGYLKAGGVGAGSTYVWRHKDTDAEFNDRAPAFRVHYGLIERLELKRRKRAKGGAENLDDPLDDAPEAD